MSPASTYFDSANPTAAPPAAARHVTAPSPKSRCSQQMGHFDKDASFHTYSPQILPCSLPPRYLSLWCLSRCLPPRWWPAPQRASQRQATAPCEAGPAGRRPRYRPLAPPPPAHPQPVVGQALRRVACAAGKHTCVPSAWPEQFDNENGMSEHTEVRASSNNVTCW
jgi:hypothetical protein